MLRLHTACSLQVPNARQPKTIVSNSADPKWSLLGSGWQFQLRSLQVKALRDETNDGRGSSGDGSGFIGRNWDPGLEIGVPFDQRPVNEYSSLKEGPIYSWGELSPGSFFIRIGTLWLITFTVLGVPIAATSFNPSTIS